MRFTSRTMQKILALLTVGSGLTTHSFASDDGAAPTSGGSNHHAQAAQVNRPAHGQTVQVNRPAHAERRRILSLDDPLHRLSLERLAFAFDEVFTRRDFRRLSNGGFLMEPAGQRQSAVHQSLREAQDIRLKSAEELSEEEAIELARSWEKPARGPNPKRDGKTYTTVEYTNLATFLKGKNLTDCAMKKVLSEIFTPGRAESLANAIYMGGVVGDENHQDEEAALGEIRSGESEEGEQGV